jgi:hypothetical protein
MELLKDDIKRSICSLFDVYSDENGVQRIVTPIEYPGTADKVVVRVRPAPGGGFTIDENGEAALYASMAGGDIDSEPMKRWLEELSSVGPVTLTDDEVLVCSGSNQKLVAPYIFRIAEAAQQLYAIATSRAERQFSDFKAKLAGIVMEVARDVGVKVDSDVSLPLAGGMVADYVVHAREPIIIVAATSTTRLLEAELIQVQYRLSKQAGKVLAICESQASVGRKQFERAGYFTWKTLTFSGHDLGPMLASQLSS